MSVRPRPVVLCVLDGWGAREDAPDNAVALAQTPFFDKAWAGCPHAFLDASEENVGLPHAQIGNSEVGHMNLGAGRVVFQDLPLIDRVIAKGKLGDNSILRKFIEELQRTGGTCHLMGLASDGGVHSHLDHIVALAKAVATQGVPVCLHAFLDGRDVAPRSAPENIENLLAALRDTQGVRLATVCGRYYALDRDKRWDRVELAYNLLVSAEGVKARDVFGAIETSYAAGVFDEFVTPVVLGDYAGMRDGDGLLFANFRTDRARELLLAFCDPAFAGFARKKTVHLSSVVGMVEYSDELNRYMTALFPPKKIEASLGEVVANAGLKQLRIAETEKYAHVTFFFNGGREEPFVGEQRILVPSPKVATYDMKPEMSAVEVTDKVVAAVESATFDLIVLNYANPDMVGHTGVLAAAVRAVEVVDECLGRLFAAVEKRGGIIFVTADHGNCERMLDPATQTPHTAHTLARVPAILIGTVGGVKGLRDGRLCDVAPTLLELMRLPKPDVMDGQSLIVWT